MVVSSSGGGTSRYGNLRYVFSVFQSTTRWLDSSANVHMYSDDYVFFLPGHPGFIRDDGE
jgi:hypothetical protein